MRIPFALFALVTLTVPAPAQETRELAAAQARFAAADRELNAVYRRARTELPEYRFEEIQEEQREWIGYRDQRSLDGARFDGGVTTEGAEKASPSYWDTAASLTETRTEILQGWLGADSFVSEWEGVWSAGYGGLLYLRETGDDTVEFFLTVVRGPTYHLGQIGGAILTNGILGRFATEAAPGDPGEETWLTFLREDGRLRIVGVNTQYWHGARAYFDGQYIRIRELGPEDQEALDRGRAGVER